MSAAKHILFINEFYDPDICASAVVAADHLPKIAKLRPDWKITVLAGNRAWDDPTRIYPSHETRNGINIVRVDRPAVRRNLISRGLGFLLFARSVRRAAKTLPKIDLVIGTTAPPQGGSLAATIAQEHHCPLIYKVLDLYPDSAVTLGRLREKSFLHRRWLTKEMAAMNQAAAVVSIGEKITQRIADTRGVSPKKLQTIHDGYDPARLAFTGKNEFAARHNPDRKFVIQYAGNMGLSHPLQTIVDAAAQLQTDPRFLFQMIGDGPARTLARAGSPQNVQWLPYQPADRLGQILAAADVCLISQHQAMFDQALPYKVYAILAAAKPAIFIGSVHSEITNWLTDDKCGVQINQGDVASLVETIRNLADHPEKKKEMSAAAQQLFSNRFNSSIAVKKWTDLIHSIANA